LSRRGRTDRPARPQHALRKMPERLQGDAARRSGGRASTETCSTRAHEAPPAERDRNFRCASPFEEYSSPREAAAAACRGRQAAPPAAGPTPEPAARAEPPASPEPALEEPSAIDGMLPPSAGEAEGHAAEAPAEAPPVAEGDEGAEEPVREPGTFDRAPPRALLVGVAAGLVLLLAVGGGLIAYRKLGHRSPPAAAVETLSAAQADAQKDSLASIASAETKARDALDVAGPRARFPEATAALARVEIQWADALTDQASRIAEKNADDARVAQLQGQAKAKVKAAFD